MKTLFFCILAMVAFSFPSLSQEDEELVPIKKAVVKKEKVPDVVQKSVSKDFNQGEPIEWSTFPYLFNQYGWTVISQDESAPDTPDRYAVYLKAKDGSRLDAVYSADGKLIRSKEVLKNVGLPKPVEISLLNSEYKDWKVDVDKELVKDYENNISKHYIVMVSKDNKKKKLYFDENGNILNNKKKKA